MKNRWAKTAAGIDIWRRQSTPRPAIKSNSIFHFSTASPRPSSSRSRFVIHSMSYVYCLKLLNVWAAAWHRHHNSSRLRIWKISHRMCGGDFLSEDFRSHFHFFHSFSHHREETVEGTGWEWNVLIFPRSSNWMSMFSCKNSIQSRSYIECRHDNRFFALSSCLVCTQPKHFSPYFPLMFSLRLFFLILHIGNMRKKYSQELNV